MVVSLSLLNISGYNQTTQDKVEGTGSFSQCPLSSSLKHEVSLLVMFWGTLTKFFINVCNLCVCAFLKTQWNLSDENTETSILSTS